jgi:leader peptidase (prepilin peptidase)/N-methyltransferase
VLVYRIPRKINFVKGFSFCPTCEHRLYPKDLVPIFSYLFLRGKCRYCREPISPRYMLVELFAGAIGLICYIYLQLPMAILCFAVGCILITLTLIDADTMTIPDSLNIALMVCAVAAIWIWPDVGLVTRIIGFFAISVPLLLISLIVAGAFGGGDIKMMAAAGFLLGWPNAIVATFIGLVLGGVYGAILLVRRKKGRKEHFAFGPCLAIGVYGSIFFGKPIIDWYLAFL